MIPVCKIPFSIFEDRLITFAASCLCIRADAEKDLLGSQIQEEVPREYLLVSWANFGRGVPWWSVGTSTTSMPIETKQVPPTKGPTRHAPRVLLGSACEWRSNRTSSDHMVRPESWILRRGHIHFTAAGAHESRRHKRLCWHPH